VGVEHHLPRFAWIDPHMRLRGSRTSAAFTITVTPLGRLRGSSRTGMPCLAQSSVGRSQQLSVHNGVAHRLMLSFRRFQQVVFDFVGRVPALHCPNGCLRAVGHVNLS
jgi:hypothetical protein